MSDSQISERESEILRLVATGATNQQIAQQLNISANTVKVHLRNIFSKIGAASRTEATLYAVRTGLVKVGNASLGAAAPPATAAESSAPAAVAQPPKVLPEAQALLIERADPIVALGPVLEAPALADDPPRVLSVAERAKPPAGGLSRRWLLGGALAALLVIAGLVFALTRLVVGPAQTPTNVPVTTGVALPALDERWHELSSMP